LAALVLWLVPAYSDLMLGYLACAFTLL
jgi:hypothetical protein